jgi:microcompartment protein CcmL/EutN
VDAQKPFDPIEAGDLEPGIAVPALGLLEFSSIALGMRAGDAMVKRAPVRALVAGSVQPGKYLVLVDGDVATVEEALAAGVEAGSPSLVDRLFLPDIHPAVGNAIGGQRWTGEIDTLGVIETRTTVGAIRAADAGLKGARVHLVELRLANGLGGKAFALVAGEQPDVEAAVELGSRVVESGNLIHTVVIPRLHGEMADNILAATRFAAQWNQSEG